MGGGKREGRWEVGGGRKEGKDGGYGERNGGVSE